jgi:hypothetical protein
VETSNNITLLGVLFLGGFVGYILALVLQQSKNFNLRILLSVIGGALGGAPILFMGGLGYQKWMYPIGLVLGTVWTRMISARNAVQEQTGKGIGSVLAWIDMFIIAAITLIIVTIAAFISV